MPIAIGFKSTNDTSFPIRRLWEEIGGFEEDAPSMAALDYPPHITLAVYDDIDARRVCSAVDALSSEHSALRISFDRIRHFDSTPLVLWAAPEFHAGLMRAHALLHRLIDPVSCRPHYRPGQWVPHSTLAMRVPDEHRDDALAFASRPIAPFTVLFDRIDCVRFPPIASIHEIALNSPVAN